MRVFFAVAGLVLFSAAVLQAQQQPSQLQPSQNSAAVCPPKSQGVPESYVGGVLEQIEPPGLKFSLVTISVGRAKKLVLWTDGEQFKLWTNTLDVPDENVHKFLDDLDESCRLPADPADAAALLKVKWESADLTPTQFAQLHKDFTDALSQYVGSASRRYNSMMVTKSRIMYLDIISYSVIYHNSYENIDFEVVNDPKRHKPMLAWIHRLQKLAENKFHRSFAPKPVFVVDTKNIGQVESVTYSPDGRTLAAGGWADEIKLWDVATRREVRTLTGAIGSVRCIAYSPDGKMLAAVDESDTVTLWDAAAGRAIRTLTNPNVHIACVAFSPDGETLASVGWDKTVKLLQVATGRTVRTLTGHTGFIESVAYSPDGRTLASGGWDNTVRLWDVVTGREIRTLNGHTGGIESVAFSPDGKILASGSLDDTVRLWQVATGREVRTLSGHTDMVKCVVFSPDGKTLASGSYDHTIRLWDVATGREIRTLTGPTETVFSVSFHPDGKTLASGSVDNTIRLWDVSTGREIWTVTAPLP